MNTVEKNGQKKSYEELMMSLAAKEGWYAGYWGEGCIAPDEFIAPSSLAQPRKASFSEKQKAAYWQGHKEGEEARQMEVSVAEGVAADKYSGPAHRLDLLTRGLMAEANGPSKNGHWWALYAGLLAKELQQIVAMLPGVLSNFSERPVDRHPEDCE